MIGRPYTTEEDLAELQHDLYLARRRVESLERAPYEGRRGDLIEWEDSLANARQRVVVLEHELETKQC